MRSKGQGLMATLLMFVPLLAVPIVATFGVPWLSAKAKTEGLPVPELPSGHSHDSGVGQSRTARHSADDLFAPVLEPPAVDLRIASPAMPHASTPATGQNPHLQNASLVVSQDEAWNDPFSNLHQLQSAPSPQDRSSEAFTPPGGSDHWTINETPPETPGESESLEAPPPSEFPEPIQEKQPTSTAEVNPFAAMESNPPREEFSESQPPEPGTPDPEVTVGTNAFEDPVPTPRINRDPNQFDASRELFAENKAPSAAPMQTAEVSPPSSPPAVEPNAPGRVEGRASRKDPLTWDIARARLKEFGITHFYLQPDAQGQVFRFRCAYSPDGNPRINRLFEAEAPNPLEAVGKVLTQLEACNIQPSATAN